jgi:glycosyltransferase involved in cell wall biosynthesis
MKTALLHYWLTTLRGGEHVLAELCRMFPEADIFTHAWDKKRVGEPFSRHRITETFIARLPGARGNCQKYLPFMPAALRRLDLSGYDLIVSSESGPVKGIRKPAGAVHVCYCHTPMRYLWDMYADYYAQASPPAKLAMALFKRPLRRYDLKSAENVDLFLANSRFVGERIKRIYGRESVVVYPPVDTEFFAAAGNGDKENYYLFVGQLIAYKRPDLAAALAARTGRKVVIAGEGPMSAELRRAAGPGVVFTGRVSRETLRRLYARARALIFPGIEDFGIVPVEAQAAGTPVIALGAGGALETVVDGKTGVFFGEATPESLIGAVEEFERMDFSPEVMRQQAQRFSAGEFRKNFAAALRDHGVTPPETDVDGTVRVQ